MKTSEKSIFALYILSIITFSLYYLHWIFETSGQMEDESRLPVTEVLLGIVTLGIYLIYWHYKTAKKVYHFAQSKGYKGISDQSVICLFLCLIPVVGSFASMCVIQTNINTLHLLETRKKSRQMG